MLPRQCLRWAADNMKVLSEREPEVPDDLDDRAADNWEPLLAIAEEAGGPWPARARATALLLSGARADAAETGDNGVQILADVRAVFANNGIDRSTTKALLSALAELEGRPWADWNRGRPLSARQLGTLLGRFGIKPGTIRVGDATPKGYLLADLTDAFARYLPDGPATSATTSNSLDKLVEFDPPPPTDGHPAEIAQKRLDFADVADVAGPTPEREPGCDDEVPF